MISYSDFVLIGISTIDVIDYLYCHRVGRFVKVTVYLSIPRGMTINMLNNLN